MKLSCTKIITNKMLVFSLSLMLTLEMQLELQKQLYLQKYVFQIYFSQIWTFLIIFFSKIQAQHAEPIDLSGPQRALISTISHGQESIEKANSMLNEKAKLPPLGNDPASYRWKETQKNTNKQSVHSQVSKDFHGVSIQQW